jgi:hypothetical protein
MARRRLVWIVIGAATGGAVGGVAIGLLERAVLSVYSLDSGRAMLFHTALGAGTGVILAAVMTAILRWANRPEDSSFGRVTR